MFESVGREEIAENRFILQGERCALCGKEIVYENYEKGDRGAWHLHHIDGNPSNDSFNNLAAVCINDPQNCHLNIAHSGDYAEGLIAPYKWFRIEGWNEDDLDDILQYTNPEDIILWHNLQD